MNVFGLSSLKLAKAKNLIWICFTTLQKKEMYVFLKMIMLVNIQ